MGSIKSIILSSSVSQQKSSKSIFQIHDRRIVLEVFFLFGQDLKCLVRSPLSVCRKDVTSEVTAGSAKHLHRQMTITHSPSNARRDSNGPLQRSSGLVDTSSTSHSDLLTNNTVLSAAAKMLLTSMSASDYLE
jgi:hypothetical protein